MSKKEYNWQDGAKIGDHTRKKHSVLERYLREYLITRCQIPQQELFRLVLVDAFAGAGLYDDKSHGSPLIFVNLLANTTNEINALRIAKGMRPVRIHCLLLLNDKQEVVELLQKHITPALEHARDVAPGLSIEAEYYSRDFEKLYPLLVDRIQVARCGNVVFNLDQYGYSDVTGGVISDIMRRWQHAEVFLTFAIASLLAFLSPQQTERSIAFDLDLSDRLSQLRENTDTLLNKKEWLGVAERVVFTHFCTCAPYVSPFSIDNPSGWRYWLMHFANSHRARQVYNNVLHEDVSVQAHYGRAGLHMLSYNPEDEMQLYLFDNTSRERAKEALVNEVSSMIAEFGNTLPVTDFYATAYSATPAHTDDIHEAIMENPDIEVIMETGGVRRKATTIRPTDTLELKRQTRLFQTFFSDNKTKTD